MNSAEPAFEPQHKKKTGSWQHVAYRAPSWRVADTRFPLRARLVLQSIVSESSTHGMRLLNPQVLSLRASRQFTPAPAGTMDSLPQGDQTLIRPRAKQGLIGKYG